MDANSAEAETDTHGAPPGRLRRVFQRGNILAMAMAFMFVLVTIVIAMHTTQARALRTVTQAEAELQFRQSAEFAVAKLVDNPSTPAGSLRVAAEEELVGDFAIPEAYSAKLWTGLPDWHPQPDQKYAPGHLTCKLVPDTSDEALKVFAEKHIWAVAHKSGGYAAYAPKGAIKLEQAMGWANPGLAEKREPPEAYSGVAPILASYGSLEVAKMPYGNAYSVRGPITLGPDDSELSLGFTGPLPLRPYEEHLKKTLQSARSDLRAAAWSGDKTRHIKGNVLGGVDSVLKMMASGDSGKLDSSLQQSMSFPFPTIAGFSQGVPGMFYEFWFHVPFPPDVSGGFGRTTREGADRATKLKEFSTALGALEAALKDLKGQLGFLMHGIHRHRFGRVAQQREVSRKIAAKQAEIDAMKADWVDAVDEITVEGAAWTTGLAAQIYGQPAVPITRSEDRTIPDTGQKGWSYARLLGDMADLLDRCMKMDTVGIAEKLKADVRLVHFGGEDYEPDFRFDDGFHAKSTWTVPRGRTFKFGGNMTIVGDLWLQKGSLMQVSGSLTLQNPDTADSGPLQPSGKLVMEEGSALIVDGDFRAAGDPRFGSLWVCSPLGKLAPISTAIMADGNVSLPYGSFSATTLEDVARSVKEQTATADTLEAFLGQVAPNLSKVAGAFHARQPYFASYASTFQLTVLPATAFNPPLSVPAPVPMPTGNLMVLFFRAMTAAYEPVINGALGENTYTHADWWAFGEGVVPATLKPDPVALAPLLSTLSLGGNLNLDWDDYLEDLLDTALEEPGKFAFAKVAHEILNNVTKGIAFGDGAGSIVAELNSRQSAFKSLQKRVTEAAVGPVRNLDRSKPKLESATTEALKGRYLSEVVGALIYADSITVGSGTEFPLMMAGMLVANGDIRVHAQSFVGSLTSFEGNISARKLYFCPLFTQASLYLPKGTGGRRGGNEIFTSVAHLVGQKEYGRELDSGMATDITTDVWRVTTEGWNR